MKNFNGFKGFICGLLVGSIGITSVFAAGGIKSAVFNSNKVILDGKILDLGGQQMISVVKDGETNASNYMPVRGVLEALGYGVSWDGSQNAVILSSGGSNNAPAISEPVVNTPTPTPAPVATPTPTPQPIVGNDINSKLNGEWRLTQRYPDQYQISLIVFNSSENTFYYSQAVGEDFIDRIGTYSINENLITFNSTSVLIGERDYINSSLLNYMGGKTTKLSFILDKETQTLTLCHSIKPDTIVTPIWDNNSKRYVYKVEEKSNSVFSDLRKQ